MKGDRPTARIRKALNGLALYSCRSAPVEADCLDDVFIQGLYYYLVERLPPFTLLRAVLENDLRGMVRAPGTEASREQLTRLLALLEGYFPVSSFGSPAKVSRWLKKPGSREEEKEQHDDPFAGVRRGR